MLPTTAGNSFTLALTTEGEVFGWGRDDYGQIGTGGGLIMDVHQIEVFPVQVRGFNDER